LKYSGGIFTSGEHFCIESPTNISIGKNVYFNRNIFLAAIEEDENSQIQIGNNCLFGPNVVIVAGNHNVYSKGKQCIRDLDSIGGSVHIGNDCWVGANVTITSGITIGDHSVIGANSVVTRNIPSYVIAAGTPAKVIRYRG
jgi:acetyltransferase-like isoleucine patch superfamily enzyme